MNSITTRTTRDANTAVRSECQKIIRIRLPNSALVTADRTVFIPFLSGKYYPFGEISRRGSKMQRSVRA